MDDVPDLKVHQHLSLTAQRCFYAQNFPVWDDWEWNSFPKSNTIQDFVAGWLFRFERRPKKDTSDILGHLSGIKQANTCLSFSIICVLYQMICRIIRGKLFRWKMVLLTKRFYFWASATISSYSVSQSPMFFRLLLPCFWDWQRPFLLTPAPTFLISGKKTSQVDQWKTEQVGWVNDVCLKAVLANRFLYRRVFYQPRSGRSSRSVGRKGI